MSTTAESLPPGVTPDVPPAPEPAKEKAKPRPYVVLRKVNMGGAPGSPSQATPQAWEFARNVDATSAEQAIRKVAEILVAASDEKVESVTLVAVTANRFQPKTVTPTTKTQLKFS